MSLSFPINTVASLGNLSTNLSQDLQEYTFSSTCFNNAFVNLAFNMLYLFLVSLVNIFFFQLFHNSYSLLHD